MTIAIGVAKSLRYKAETTWNTAAGASGGQILRRITSNLALKKQTYQSEEIQTSRQLQDMRHGVRSVEGSIVGELSPGTWIDLIAAAVRKTFAATSSITGLSITVAASGSNYTLTRGSGSWISDGIKLNDVVRLTAGSFDAANTNKNLLVLAETATVLTVKVLNGVAMTAEGPISSATLAVPGKKAYAPASGHTDTSFSIEHWHSDVSLSELFTGCKINSLKVEMPPTGIAKITADIIGADITTAGSVYYSSPTAVTSTGVLAAVNGVLTAAGSAIAVLTALDFTLTENLSPQAVVGQNTYANIAPARILVSGNFSALFQDATLRDYFINETEIGLGAVLTTSSAAAADFVGFSLPRIKVGGASKDDGEKNLIQTFPFTALYNSAGGSGTTTDTTTISVQDSQA